MEESYVCPACRRTFDKIETDDEVMEEARVMWGNVDPEQLVTVCDECFKAVMVKFGIVFE